MQLGVWMTHWPDRACVFREVADIMVKRLPRCSGLLLHPTSLPGRYGIGDLGLEAEAFLDFLARNGQKWWQVLPLGPTGYGNSPYQSLTSHAGNPLLISPDRLIADGLLNKADIKHYPRLPVDRVDYEAVNVAKDHLLRKAFERFDRKHRDFRAYCQAESHWLSDFALFLALKKAHAERSWAEWEPELIRREPQALARVGKELHEDIEFARFVQFVFDRQWRSLKQQAGLLGLGFIGDVPIFVAHDSADVWSHPELFHLDENGRPKVKAGVPPDYFSRTGQLWGNPLYDWPVHARDGYAWWADRLRATLQRVDVVRLDHFRGFQAYWEVPGDAPTAEATFGAKWVLGPGADFLEAMQKALGGLPLIAEDLGFITYEVHALRDQFALPGMRILQFAFAPNSEPDRPYHFPNNCVVYTGTHDNDTTVGWFTSHAATTESAEAIAAEKELVLRYLGTNGGKIHWDLIRLALASVADTAIFPVQDLLGLGSEGRMNTPGTESGNWLWRMRSGALTPAIGERLGTLTSTYGRWNLSVPKPDETAKVRRPRCQ